MLKVKPYLYYYSWLSCLLIVVVAGCSPKLRENFIQENEKIHIEQWGNYFPNIYKGLVSENYPGILALGDEEFIFDAQGPGSRPWMKPMSPFTIKKADIKDSDISEVKSLNKRVLTIKTIDGIIYGFLISNGEPFYTKLLNWVK